MNGTERILVAARAAGLVLDDRRVELDESGADFMVAHARDGSGRRWIVRLPRRPDVLPRAEIERAVLRLVGPKLPVAVPEWRYFTPEVIAYPRMEGDPAATIDLNAGGYLFRFDAAHPPRSFVDSLGRALAALHAIPPDEAGDIGLRVRTPYQMRSELAEQMERAGELLTIPDGLWRRWQRWLAEDSYWPASSTLVHGDLHPAHILIDDEHRVIGLLDWTEAHVADPAMDFTLQFAAMGEVALDALLDGYRRAGGTTWPRMREHISESWLAYPVTVAEFARVSGEEAHRAFAQQLVDAGAASVAA